MWAHRAVGTRVFARRAVVAVQVAVLFSVLVGFAALVIDVGAMYNVRADLQRTADASALAGASIYTSDDMMRIRMGTADSSLLGTIILMAGLVTAGAYQFGKKRQREATA